VLPPFQAAPIRLSCPLFSPAASLVIRVHRGPGHREAASAPGPASGLRAGSRSYEYAGSRSYEWSPWPSNRCSTVRGGPTVGRGVGWGQAGAAEILPFGPTADGRIYDLERLRDAQARPAAAPVRTGEHDFRCDCYRRRCLWVAMDLENARGGAVARTCRGQRVLRHRRGADQRGQARARRGLTVIVEAADADAVLRVAVGGRIFLDSPRGAGTCLRVELPLRAENGAVSSR
jgi:hypothetical protein